MAVQGHYNHYDDPDEFWDDEPIVRKQPAIAHPLPPPIPEPAPPRYEPTPTHTESWPREAEPAYQPRVGSSFASMQLDRGFLPVRIDLGSGWSRYVGPHEVGEELLAAYRGAVVERLKGLYSSGRWPSPQEVSEAAVPDRRTVLMVLLETRTWEQYCEVSSSMVNGARYEVNGRVVIEGRHPVTVSADRRYLRSITVWSDWAARTHPEGIVDEILWCADNIRSLRPKFTVRGDYSRYSDADLEYHLDHHRLQLLQEKVG
ncbi:hypothetical protein ACL02S_08695 [Nocardia sp. 004]|uniref:hypothetical protein n=1 Tax=Nocardia sp. 004 TaxID=3385978 RepID=UPI0039A298A5